MQAMINLKSKLDDPEQAYLLKSRSSRFFSGRILSPLQEGLDTEDLDKKPGRASSFSLWRRNSSEKHEPSAVDTTDLKLLLGGFGAPLAPVAMKDFVAGCSLHQTYIEASSAQYIILQYLAATGGNKLENSIQNTYILGKVGMTTSAFGTATKVVHIGKLLQAGKSGKFVLWQMKPDKWYIELAISGSKIHAGSDGKLVWQNNPWLGCHVVKGPLRPLRRTLQGLDPKTTANIFCNALCIGEKTIGLEDCFVLKVVSDPETLAARSSARAELIRHVLYGYFSQKTGLLIHLEDSHLTRIQQTASDTVYWESMTETTITDYRRVDGINIAHAGCSVLTLFRFGDASMSHTRTQLKETWTIEEVEYNVAGVSVDMFLPPADIKKVSTSELSYYPLQEKSLRNCFTVGSKVAAPEKKSKFSRYETKH